MKLLQRITRAWELSKAPEEISNEKLKQFLAEEPLGDGKAEFLGEGTDEEFKDQIEKDKGFKAKPFGL